MKARQPQDGVGGVGGEDLAPPRGWGVEEVAVVLVELAEEEEEEDRVEVPEFHCCRRWRRQCGGGGGALHGVFEEGEVGEEVAGDEEGFVVEGEGLEVAESEGEESRGGEERDEAAEVAAEEGGDGVGEMREVRRRESGERGHDYGFCGVDAHAHHHTILTTICFSA